MTNFRVVPTIILLSVLNYISPVSSTELRINVVDLKNEPIADTVVELLSEQTVVEPANLGHYEMTQKNRTFIPFVLAVPKGAKVDFPNLDRTRHHVYSFSEAKPFELKLYVGKAEAPITFEQPGVVALGCNIHDYMQGFIYIANSALVSVANESGSVMFKDLALGEYKVKIWHPWQKSVSELTDLVLVAGDNQLSVSLDIERQAKPSAPPSGFGNFDSK